VPESASLMRQADIIICQAGGSTLAEVLALAKPAFVTPHPWNATQATHFALLCAQGLVAPSAKLCPGPELDKTIRDLIRGHALARHQGHGAQEVAAELRHALHVS
jgi:UDP-N-acetylglucosamine:LPS N-acetylglucosamine transferase